MHICGLIDIRKCGYGINNFQDENSWFKFKSFRLEVCGYFGKLIEKEFEKESFKYLGIPHRPDYNENRTG